MPFSLADTRPLFDSARNRGAAQPATGALEIDSARTHAGDAVARSIFQLRGQLEISPQSDYFVNELTFSDLNTCAY
jgi:hypothetical protein